MAEEDGDTAEASRLYRMAAQAGHGPSRYNLGLLLASEGGAADALAWLTLAAEEDVPNAAAAQDALGKAVGYAVRMRARNLADVRR